MTSFEESVLYIAWLQRRKACWPQTFEEAMRDSVLEQAIRNHATQTRAKLYAKLTEHSNRTVKGTL